MTNRDIVFPKWIRKDNRLRIVGTRLWKSGSDVTAPRDPLQFSVLNMVD